ncbi:MAG: phosphotransferase family protein [Gammaproteobacteria bacterium]|nr:phosphotransferase family protein [Gammaproteobacteria bacterium]
MTDENSPQAALQQIPGWEHATWSRLDGGQTNWTWLVEADGRRAVLKVDAQPRGTPFNDRHEEARIQRIAAEQNLANHVLFANETVYLTEYVDGDIWNMRQVADERRLIELARLLQRVHSLPLTGRQFDAPGAARQYIKNIGDADPVIADRCLGIIESVQLPRDLTFCHNDLVVENILDVDGLRLLDWEYACDNDPLFDLATIVSHYGLSRKQTNTLLDAYFNGDGARWQAQLVEQVHLYEALYWLWRASRS